MVITATGKVLGVNKSTEKKEVSSASYEEYKRRLFEVAHYNYKKIAEVRLNKINHQLNLLMQMQQLNHAQYTKKDVQSLISDIQHTLNVVEDYLLVTCVEEP